MIFIGPVGHWHIRDMPERVVNKTARSMSSAKNFSVRRIRSNVGMKYLTTIFADELILMKKRYLTVD